MELKNKASFSARDWILILQKVFMLQRFRTDLTVRGKNE